MQEKPEAKHDELSVIGTDGTPLNLRDNINTRETSVSELRAIIKTHTGYKKLKIYHVFNNEFGFIAHNDDEHSSAEDHGTMFSSDNTCPDSDCEGCQDIPKQHEEEREKLLKSSDSSTQLPTAISKTRKIKRDALTAVNKTLCDLDKFLTSSLHNKPDDPGDNADQKDNDKLLSGTLNNLEQLLALEDGLTCMWVWLEDFLMTKKENPRDGPRRFQVYKRVRPAPSSSSGHSYYTPPSINRPIFYPQSEDGYNSMPYFHPERIRAGILNVLASAYVDNTINIPARMKVLKIISLISPDLADNLPDLCLLLAAEPSPKETGGKEIPHLRFEATEKKKWWEQYNLDINVLFPFPRAVNDRLEIIQDPQLIHDNEEKKITISDIVGAGGKPTDQKIFIKTCMECYYPHLKTLLIYAFKDGCFEAFQKLADQISPNSEIPWLSTENKIKLTKELKCIIKQTANSELRTDRKIKPEKSRISVSPCLIEIKSY